MKAKEKAFYARYKSTSGDVCELWQVYSNPSYYKVRAYDYCREIYYKLNGYGFKITSANTSFFSIGFLYDTIDEETGEIITHCHYRTGRNVYDFIVPCEEV